MIKKAADSVRPDLIYYNLRLRPTMGLMVAAEKNSQVSLLRMSISTNLRSGACWWRLDVLKVFQNSCSLLFLVLIGSRIRPLNKTFISLQI